MGRLFMDIIKDFRYKKNFSFGLYNRKLNEDIIAKLLITRALYCYVDDDFNILRYKSQSIDKIKVDFKSEVYQQSASFKTGNADYDDFEKHYITNIAGEKMFRNFFFSKDDDYIDSYNYFIFQPFILSLEKEIDHYYRIYPVVKIVDEIVIVEFNFYPPDGENSIGNFSDRLIRMPDLIKEIKLPYTYFLALGIEVNMEESEGFSFEDNDSAVFKMDNENIRNIFDVALLFIDLIFTYEGCSWFGRTVISLDEPELSREEIEYLKNGFHYDGGNKLYDSELIDFRESKDSKLYVFGHLTLTLGNILESYLPAVILDQEISIVNTKLIVHSKSGDEEKPIELLNRKNELQKLRGQIDMKYTSILSFHSAMKYAMEKIFNVNNAIKRIDDQLEINFRRKEYQKYERDFVFQTIIGIVSVLLSLSAIFEFIITPIYELRFNRSMDPLDTLLNYFILLIAGLLMIVGYLFILTKKKRKS